MFKPLCSYSLRLIAALFLAIITGQLGWAQNSDLGDRHYRLLELQLGVNHVAVSGGSVAFEANGIFGWSPGGSTSVGSWSQGTGILPTVQAKSLGSDVQFQGVELGSLLLGVRSNSSRSADVGLTIGIREQNSRSRPSLVSLVDSNDSPPRTEWLPPANRYGETFNPTIPSRAGFFTLHGGIRNDDEVSVAYLPVFEATWTSQKHLFVLEGPTFDRYGNAYFTPYQPEEDSVMLVSVDGETGARRFGIPGAELYQGGAPLILNHGGGQAVYTGGAERIIAVSAETGALLWEQTELLALLASGNGAEDEIRRLLGINYHVATDTLIAAYTNGFLVALDRGTGEILGSIDLPGDPALPGNNDSTFLEMYAEEIDAELEAFDLKDFGAEEFASVLLGGDVVIANYFSVDPNSARLWVGGTLPDEDDGVLDGRSALGALYGIDVTRGEQVNFSIATQVGFQGSSASTAALRADGERIYIADGESQVMAFDRSGNQVWMIDVGSQVFGSLAVSSFGTIYASTALGVTKIREVDDTAEIEWEATLDSIYTTIPDGWQVRNLLLVGIGANGVTVLTGLGPLNEFGTGLPVRMSVTLLDRATGMPINSTAAVEESVAAMNTSPDGAVVLANSPARRVILRVLTAGQPGQRILAPPVVGGLTKYGARKRFDLLARDASFAALSMLQNAEQTFQDGDQLGGASGVRDTQDLITQTMNALQKALLKKELPSETVISSQQRLDAASKHLDSGKLNLAIGQLQIVSDSLNVPARPTP